MPKPKSTEYFLTMFLLEGHDRWRSHVGKSAECFDRQSKHDNWPKVVAKKVSRIDRLTGEISDGYHTFDELYDHRITLFIALCKLLNLKTNTPIFDGMDVFPVWRSKLHSDGKGYSGWFILGINQLEGEQITYHLPIDRWEETNFAFTYDKAPEWDGHTSNDVLIRLKNLYG